MGQLRRVLVLAFVLVASFAGLSAVAGAATAPTWLCLPGHSPDPCAPKLTAERFSATGQSLGVDHLRAGAKAKFDCFYVYPTISNEPTAAADLAIGPEQNSIALYQASQYSQDCNVYAPVYRQLTLTALNGGATATAQDSANAYDDVANAFQYYLKHYNKGRGFVLMGHSQGSFTLRRLIAKVIDPSAKLRKQMISAVIPGGNVVVGTGPTGTGGDFENVGVCRTDKQTGCVIGWSLFDGPVPANALFGHVGTASPTQPGSAPPAGTKILCSDPARLAGIKSGLVDGLYPEQPFAAGLLSLGISLLGATVPPSAQPFYELVGAYKVACSSADGANVLQVTAQGTAPVLRPSPDATWGLHLVDVSLTWGTMVKVVAVQGQTWLAKQPKPHRSKPHTVG